MDLLPKVGGVDQYASEQRPGTGSYSRKKKRDNDRERRDGGEDQSSAPEMPVDPLLAELDRLRAMDPSLTESGAHRAMLALRAYQHPPVEPLLEGEPPPPPAPPAIDAAAPEPGR